MPKRFFSNFLPCFRVLPFLALVLALSGVPEGLAEPRFTALYGQDCSLCHVNPTGGGLRSLYASQYLVPEELARPTRNEDGLASLNPEITPGLTMGADLRTLLYQQEGGDGSVFSMQGDLYVHGQVSPEVGIYFEQGQSRAGEIFGAAHLLPLDGYVKAGRFIADYGWRFADHQMFNRRYLYDPGGSDDPGVQYGSGLEVGVSPGIFTATASVQEVARGNPDPRLGDNYAYRALIQKSFGGFRTGLGGSVVRRADPSGHLRAAGGFWYLGVGPVTWLGEIDETRQGETLGLLAAHELGIRFVRGWEVLATYNFQDPDRAQRSGARHRAGGGVQVMPAPFFSTQIMVNYWWLDQGPAVSGTDYGELQLLAHFFF